MKETKKAEHITEFAERMGISRATAYNWIKKDPERYIISKLRGQTYITVK